MGILSWTAGKIVGGVAKGSVSAGKAAWKSFSPWSEEAIRKGNAVNKGIKGAIQTGDIDALMFGGRGTTFKGNAKMFGITAGAGVVISAGVGTKTAADKAVAAPMGKVEAGRLANMITDASTPGFDDAMSLYDNATQQEAKKVSRQIGLNHNVDGDIVFALHQLRRG